MRFAVCGLRFAVCGLRFAVCGLRFAVCGKVIAVGMLEKQVVTTFSMYRIMNSMQFFAANRV